MRIRRIAVLFLALAGNAIVPAASAHGPVGTTAGDIIFGSNGNDHIHGGGGNDIIFGKAGSDVLAGDLGHDSLFGGSAPDRLNGGSGNDTLYDDDTRPGDVLMGKDGNDVLYSIDGRRDTIDCGVGFDIAFVDRGDSRSGCETVIFRNRRFAGSQVIIGSNDADLFDFGDADHIVFGRGSNDMMRTGEGEDLIFGGRGADFLLGEDDDDTIVDDDSNGDAIRPGDGDDVIFMANGTRDSVDCSEEGDSGSGDTVYADVVDAVIDCGTVFRG